MIHLVPDSIAYDGSRDVTDELNLWIAETALADKNPTIIFKSYGTYLCQYGLAIGSKGKDVLHPDLPDYSYESMHIMGNDATIIQNDNGNYRVKKADGTYQILDPRKRWGLRLMKCVGGSNLVVEDLHFEGGNSEGRSSVNTQKESWIGIQTIGTQNAVFNNISEKNVWSDFFYFANHKLGNVITVSKNIEIKNSIFQTAGRQGFVINSVHQLDIHHCTIRNVKRYVFDSEPTNGCSIQDINIHDNDMSGGNLGTIQISVAGRLPISNYNFSNNKISANPMIIDVPVAKADTDGDGDLDVVFRSNISIVGNQVFNETKPYQGRGGMIAINSWDQVNVSSNTCYMAKPTTKPTQLTNCTNIVEEGNQWIVVQ